MSNSGINYKQTNNMHLDNELISAYIDGEVTPQEATRVERHLQECERCADELASLQWTVNLVRELPTVPVPHSFVVREADLEPEPAPRRSVLPNWLVSGLQWATVATAILAVLVFSADLFVIGRQPAASAPVALMQEAQPVQPTEEEVAPLAAEAPQGTPVPEAEREIAPAVPATVVKERTEAVELADGPQEKPAEEPRALAEEPVEEAEEEPAGAMAAPEPTPPVVEALEHEARAGWLGNPLRILEVALVGLSVVLLILTLWARRQRAT